MSLKKPDAPKTYPAHRERQSRRILDAARLLFDEKGIDRVTMAEITSGSGVRASTIYQYFSSKEDIVWAIAGDIMGRSIDRVEHAFNAAPTAFAQIAALLEIMVNDLERHQAEVRFMAQFDAMYARDWPTERLLTLESQLNPDGFSYFSKLIRQGIADGSLRHDLDPDLTLHAVINALVGAQRRLASLGNKVEQEYGVPIDRLFRETIRILLLGLGAPQPAANDNEIPPVTAKPAFQKPAIKKVIARRRIP